MKKFYCSVGSHQQFWVGWSEWNLKCRSKSHVDYYQWCQEYREQISFHNPYSKYENHFLLLAYFLFFLDIHVMTIPLFPLFMFNLLSAVCFIVVVVHTGPKANTNKTQTNRFTWFPKTGYVHGGSRLYINGGMIQTLNSTQYNPTKPSVSLLHSVFLSNLHFLTLTVALSLLPLHTCFLHTQHFLYAFSRLSSVFN